MKLMEIAKALHVTQEKPLLALRRYRVRTCGKATGKLHKWTDEEFEIVRNIFEKERANGKQD